MMDRETALKAILGLSVVGLIVAGYQTYEHYYLGSAFCDLSATFSCSVVTESRFGELPQNSGIAVAAWGVVWWLGVIALATGLKKGKDWFTSFVEDPAFPLFAWVATGVGFIAYLLTVELYILPQETGALVICPFCTVQHVLILVILFLVYGLLSKPILDSVKDVFYTEA